MVGMKTKHMKNKPLDRLEHGKNSNLRLTEPIRQRPSMAFRRQEREREVETKKMLKRLTHDQY